MFDHYYSCNSNSSIDSIDKPLSTLLNYGANKCMQFFPQNETYKSKVNYEKRCQEYNKIKKQYPNHVPIIINSVDPDLNISKIKYLVHEDASASELIFSIRKQAKLDKGSAIFIFFNNSLLCSSELMKTIYEKNKKSNYPGIDNFIYLDVTKENTFG